MPAPTVNGVTARSSTHARASGAASASPSSVSQVQDLDPALAQQVGEGIVLLARAPYPEDVVEQQLVMVRRGSGA